MLSSSVQNESPLIKFWEVSLLRLLSLNYTYYTLGIHKSYKLISLSESIEENIYYLFKRKSYIGYSCTVWYV